MSYFSTLSCGNTYTYINNENGIWVMERGIPVQVADASGVACLKLDRPNEKGELFKHVNLKKIYKYQVNREMPVSAKDNREMHINGFGRVEFISK